MPAERYYIEKALETGALIPLQDQEFHHLVRVMRAKVGDEVEVVNGQGCLATATVKSIEKRQALLSVRDCQKKAKPSFEVILAQAIPRINRLDYILEKGTELGMTQLWLFPGEHSERKELTEHQLERAKAITIAALKQCGRLWLPTIELKPKLEAWQGLDYTGLYGDVSPQAPGIRQIWDNAVQSKGIVFWIGPESGFTELEEGKLKQLGARGVKLHPNILRTDTAALVALSLVYSLDSLEHKL